MYSPFHQNDNCCRDEADCLYFVYDGQVEILGQVSEEDSVQERSILKCGQTFGELALLAGPAIGNVESVRRRTTAIAIQKSILGVVKRDDFSRILKRAFIAGFASMLSIETSERTEHDLKVLCEMTSSLKFFSSMTPVAHLECCRGENL